MTQSRRSTELQDALGELREYFTYAGIREIPSAWLERRLPAAAVAAEVSDARSVGVSSLLAPAAEGGVPHALTSEEVVNPSQTPPPPLLQNVDTVSEMDWETLERTALGCRLCRLCETRTKVVFGVGKRQAPLIAFVGEGPGADEDRVGEPFVGKAGQLLTAAITKGMGLSREAVYIANVVKCRPPENRTPLPDEVKHCSSYLFRQLELLQPKVIVALGGPAQQALTGGIHGITKVRGTWMKWNEIPLMPTFHPAYVLRNPAAKREFWEDFQAVMQFLGLPVPPGKQASETQS